MPTKEQYRKNREKYHQQRLEYYWRNRERAQEASKEWREANKANHRAYQEAYRKQHAAEVKQYQHEWYLKRRKEQNRAAIEWAREHPDQRKVIRDRWQKSTKGKKYRATEGYKAKARLRQRRYYKRHLAARRKKNLQNAKRYYRKHREVILVKVAERAKQYPERSKQAQAKWMRSEKGKRTIQRRGATRRAQLKKGGDLTTKQWHAKLKRYHHRCARCRESKKLHLHHVLPLAWGGRNTIRNVIPLCHPCHVQTHRELNAARTKAMRAPAPHP